MPAEVSSMTIPVGFTGVKLEVGLDEDGKPISIMDYLKYKFALKHPHVALTEDEMNKVNKKVKDFKNLATAIQKNQVEIGKYRSTITQLEKFNATLEAEMKQIKDKEIAEEDVKKLDELGFIVQIEGLYYEDDEYYEYELVGVVIHAGTTDSGHYYSLVRDRDVSNGARWYKFNDDTVSDPWFLNTDSNGNGLKTPRHGWRTVCPHRL